MHLRHVSQHFSSCFSVKQDIDQPNRELVSAPSIESYFPPLTLKTHGLAGIIHPKSSIIF